MACNNILFLAFDHRAGETGGHAPVPPPFFRVAKRKKGNKGKQERLSKQKPLKGCH